MPVAHPPPPANGWPAEPSARITIAAPAKVNLYLEVLGRRSDGFHELETIFQTVELADRITVELHAEGAAIALVCDDPTLPADAGNLAWRAAVAFCAGRSPAPGALSITLAKAIPHGAGLGGGSSDAAAVLRALDRLLPGWHTPAGLHAIAADLGSDVPYFLIGGTAWGGGRGERLVALPELPPLPVTLLMPLAPLPTPAVFAALTAEERSVRQPRGDGWWRDALAACDGPRLAGLLHNRLADSAARLRPEVAALQAWLRESGVPAIMSGSGSAFVAVGEVQPPAGVRAWSTRLRPSARLDQLSSR